MQQLNVDQQPVIIRTLGAPRLHTEVARKLRRRRRRRRRRPIANQLIGNACCSLTTKQAARLSELLHNRIRSARSSSNRISRLARAPLVAIQSVGALYGWLVRSNTCQTVMSRLTGSRHTRPEWLSSSSSRRKAALALVSCFGLVFGAISVRIVSALARPESAPDMMAMHAN